MQSQRENKRLQALVGSFLKVSSLDPNSEKSHVETLGECLEHLLNMSDTEEIVRTDESSSSVSDYDIRGIGPNLKPMDSNDVNPNLSSVVNNARTTFGGNRHGTGSDVEPDSTTAGITEGQSENQNGVAARFAGPMEVVNHLLISWQVVLIIL